MFRSYNIVGRSSRDRGRGGYRGDRTRGGVGGPGGAHCRYKLGRNSSDSGPSGGGREGDNILVPPLIFASTPVYTSVCFLS